MALKSVFSGYAAAFPERLRLLMKAREVRQHELSAALGLRSRQSITGYLDGSVLPPIDKILGIADFFNVSVDWLLCRPGATLTTESDIKAACDALKLTEQAITALQEVAVLPLPNSANITPIEALAAFLSHEGIKEFAGDLARLFGKRGAARLTDQERVELEKASAELSQKFGRTIEAAPVSGTALQMAAEASAKEIITDIYWGEV